MPESSVGVAVLLRRLAEPLEARVHPRTAGLPAKRTGRETTQPDRVALEHWATGLEPLYLDGAFARVIRWREDMSKEGWKW